jgi:hypothetical protein
VKHPVESLEKVRVHAVNLPPILDFADDAIRKLNQITDSITYITLLQCEHYKIEEFYRVDINICKDGTEDGTEDGTKSISKNLEKDKKENLKCNLLKF